MNSQQIIESLKARFGPNILAAFPAEAAAADKHPRVHVSAEHWRELAALLHSDP